MKAEVHALREGRISFDQFAKATQREWQRLASRLFRSYRLPAGVELEDVVQEMQLHAWQAVGNWDATKGTTLVRFVTWTAYTQARRWVNVQRNAYRRSDHVPGRYPVTHSELTGGDPEATIDNMLRCEPDADVCAAARRRFVEVAAELEDEGLRLALEAWAVTGCEAQAVQLLEQDIRAVLALKLWTPGAAQRLVRQAVDAALPIAAVA